MEKTVVKRGKKKKIINIRGLMDSAFFIILY